MDNEENKPVEQTGETKTVELTPELQAKLEQIKLEDEQKSKASNGRNIKPMIGAIACLLLIAGTAIGLTVFKKGSTDNGGGAAKKEDNEPLEITKVEKKKVLEALSILNFTDPKRDDNAKFVDDGIFHSSAFMITYIPELYKNEGYTTEQKLLALLHNEKFYNDRFEKIDSKYTEDDFKDYIGAKNTLIADWKAFKEYVKVLPAEYVATRYEEVYGEELKHQDAKEMCGGFEYDEKLGVYLSGLYDACGGVDFRSVLLRVFSWGSSTEEYHVDANVVTTYVNNAFEEQTCNVYNGLVEDIVDDNGNVKKDLAVYNTCKFNSEGGTDYTLTDDDVDTAAKYRFTFDKEFHFKGIKKL